MIQNILLVSRAPTVVKLTDFGIAKHWGGSSLRTHCGTLCYQAPEQLGLLPREWSTRGRHGRENSYTSAIDIWALGAIVHQMLTSEVPFLDTYQDLFLDELDSLPAQEEATLDMGLVVDYAWGRQPFPANSLLTHRVGRCAIDFVKSVMAPKPSDRLTAETALQSEWFVGTTPRLVVLVRWFSSLGPSVPNRSEPASTQYQRRARHRYVPPVGRW